MNRIIPTAVIALLALFTLAGAARAADPDPFTVSASAAYAERYLWRGIPLNEEAVLQPGVAISRGGLSVGAWASIDLTDFGRSAGYGDEYGNPTEIDFFATYAIPLGEKAELTGGFLTYTFPHTEFNSTTEIFAGLAFDVPGSPRVTTYIDEDLAEGGNYTSIDLSHSFPLAEQGDWGLSLDLAGHAAYANHKYFELYYGLDETPNWSDWSATVALPVSMPAGLTLTPTYLYSAIILDDARDAVDDWGRDPEAGIFLLTLSWGGEL